MFQKISSRILALALTVSAPAVMASGAGEDVKLNCPAGTKQRRMSEKSAVYCAKTDIKAHETAAHGQYMSFHPNGQKKAVGELVHGKQTGLWTFFDENGRKSEEIEYSAHHYNGRHVQFFPSGKVKLEEKWVKGKREGTAVAYAEDGQKQAEREYRAGHLIKEQRFENGKPVSK